jgi:hypothetical protein
MGSLHRRTKPTSRLLIGLRFIADSLYQRLRLRDLPRSLRRISITMGLLWTWVTPAAHATGIYWANTPSHTIGRANLDGTGANQGFITGPDSTGGVAVDETFLYWTNLNLGTIGRAHLDGTGVNQAFITGGSTTADVAVDGSFIYWVDSDLNTIGRAKRDGTDVNQSFIAATGLQGALSGVAVDGTFIYWTNRTSGTIGRANLDGTGLSSFFIPGATEPGGVAVDETFIYWTNRDFSLDSGTIGRANLDGTGVNQSFISGASNPRGVAVSFLPEPTQGLLVLLGVGLAACRRRQTFPRCSPPGTRAPLEHVTPETCRSS